MCMPMRFVICLLNEYWLIDLLIETATENGVGQLGLKLGNVVTAEAIRQ